jgi:hypothetical protein
MDNLIAEANVELGTFEQRKPTKEEIQADKDFQAQCSVRDAQRQAEAEARTTAKAALLAQLGITEEQAKLLLS